MCTEQLSFASGHSRDSGSRGAHPVRGLLRRSRRKGLFEDDAGSGGEAIELWVSYNTGERAEVMAGKMEPGTWSVCNIAVRFLDTSGRHFCKELRNVVFKEGLAYLECAGRFKEHFRSRRGKRCR